MKNPEFRTRFAPSPTGPLHLGHAYSAMLAHDMARAAGGAFLLRIEDIDQARARDEWEQAIYEDLAWLGLTWETPALRQSERSAVYREGVDGLWAEGLLFACSCNRRDVRAAAAAPNEGEPVFGPDGIVYPGTCRARKSEGHGPPPEGYALRLDMAAALERAGIGAVAFEETGTGPAGETGRIEVGGAEMIRGVGDVVLARRDMGTSYHLSVVIDDAAQGISHVVRGQDLFEATQIHVVLQRLLGLPTPVYHHHRLIRDDAGKRLAKRDDARAIRTYRADGASPADIRCMVGL
ncbi:tRNA glutamyl-Q(34) synthetase GluQRS [Ovoidimarina sediminis]|uniref:tRNA glutamyl-Q(34) synthetase GluQRS n=1 Tax=Ovoidimarina sediminis TaxID=3079856 RepID=UPI00290C42AE|nr:tRNA glutamyl-Q(34) synthetase GluQRS [Rhodophyticola sp. MJ-SS7]MDU8941977.1 tRNA glutamyl-Q(34) synthetase GluQRS [Rhodophyticola sp. MJ-SS7]